MALLLGVVGLFFNMFLVIIAVFIWIGAKGEASVEQLKSALTGLTVSEGMISEYRVLAPHDPLARAAELTLAGFQQDFPVMDGSGLRGVLTHADLLKGLAGSGAQTPVGEVMQGRFETAAPSEMLEVALEKLQRCECRALIVVQDEKVVGLVTPENIGEMLTIDRALRASRARLG